MSPEALFLHVVEAGSFKKVAEALGIETSSVSRKVAALEDRLKAKLLYRSTTKTRPTELGQIYYAGLRQLVDNQQALEEEVFHQANSMKGNLRIGATVDLGEQFILPVITQMQKESPDLSIELILGSDIDNLAEKNLDVSIRFGALKDSNLIAKHLNDIPRVLVASPGYLEKHGIPQQPEDLNEHHFVLYTRQQANVDIAFQDGSKLTHSAIHSRLMVNSLRAIRTLVRSGAGINSGPLWLYQEDMNTGKLVEVLPHQPVSGFSV